MLYDKKEDVLILSPDCVDYDVYSKLACVYLQIDESQRKVLVETYKEQLGERTIENAEDDNIIEVISILDKVTYIRKVNKYRQILNKQITNDLYDNYKLLLDLNAGVESKFLQQCNTFQLGYIMGKRAERTRRKKVQA